MVYMGSKRRFAKAILEIVLADHSPRLWYVEPFVGGANTIDKVYGKRIGADTHTPLIAMYKAMQRGWIPPEKVSVDEYRHMRDHPSLYPAHLRGFVGFTCSFGARWWGGYARGARPDTTQHTGKPDYRVETNYACVGVRSALKQLPYIQNVIFRNEGYRRLSIPEGATIYCDPPYYGTTRYGKREFHTPQFWEWARWKSRNHRIFVSEQEAPPDFRCVWEAHASNLMGVNTTGIYEGSLKRVERLFVRRSTVPFRKERP